MLPPVEAQLERVTALTDSLCLVRRMECPAPAQRNSKPLDLLLGFDIGSSVWQSNDPRKMHLRR